MRTLTIVVLSAALVLALLLAVLGLTLAARAPDRPDIDVPRTLSMLALTQHHAALWESSPPEQDFLTEMIDELGKSVETDVRWRAYVISNDAAADRATKDSIDTLDAAAIEQLQRQDGPRREVFSDDGRHYVRAVIAAEQCMVCHVGPGVLGAAPKKEDATKDDMILGFHVIRLEPRAESP
jgi:hypothetical protein